MSIEEWLKKPVGEVVDAGVVTAKRGYEWITKWELGKNYIRTEIIDENERLVGVYWDITSQVRKIISRYQAYDWYLDIFKTSDGEVFLLDEDEFREALEAGFLTKEEAEIALKNARKILKQARRSWVGVG